MHSGGAANNPLGDTHTTRFAGETASSPHPRCGGAGGVGQPRCAGAAVRGLGRPGGHSEGQNTRSHPELGRENPQRRWYCVLRRGRVGRRQARQDRSTSRQANPVPHQPRHRRAPNSPKTLSQAPPVGPGKPTNAGWSSPVARQAHNLKVIGSNPIPATNIIWRSPSRSSGAGFLLPDARLRMPARWP